MALTILLIDDAQARASYLDGFLRDRGYRVLPFRTNPAQTVFEIADHIRWMRFDVALLGATCSVEARPILANFILRVSSSTRIIFLSESAGHQEAALLSSDGFDEVVMPAYQPILRDAGAGELGRELTDSTISKLPTALGAEDLSDKLAGYERAGAPAAENNEVPPMGSTAEELAGLAEELSWRARFSHWVADQLAAKAEGREVEEDIPWDEIFGEDRNPD